MTTPESGSDPYADSGGSGRDVQPGVPGWSAGQDWYTGPVYDDTGWHIDLSNVSWAGNASASQQDEDAPWADGYGAADSNRYETEDRQAGNGAAPLRGRPDAPDERPSAWPEQPPQWDRSERSSGRHARRHARPNDEQQPGPAQRPASGGERRPGLPQSRPRPRRAPRAWPPDPGREPDSRDTSGYQQSGYDGPGSQLPVYDAPVYEAPVYEAPAREPTGFVAPGSDAPPYEPRPYEPRPYPPGGRPGQGQARPRGPVPRPAGMPPAVPPPGPGTGLPGGPRPSGPPSGRPQPGGPQVYIRPEGVGPASIVSSSGAMAVGTLASRLTGFLRTIVQSAALGTFGIAAAYNLSNTLPNVVYSLALGGILTSVIVPLIVNAAKRDSGRGDGYDQRMFTLITAALAGVTLLATAAAVPIVHLYAGDKITQSAPTLHLAILFALFFIPQIFFYGVSSLIGAILNSRGSFAAPMWTPIVNNLVVIGVLGLYVAVAGLHKRPGTLSGFEIELLGAGTTLGIIAQTVALLPALRRVGFRWRPRTDFRRSEVAEIGRMAGWMFGYVVATQIAFLVTTKVAGDASLAGITQYNYAWLLFQLPYAVVGISVITALLPRMSAHASDGRYGLVRQDFSAGLRLASTIVVPCSLVLAVLGPKLAEVFLGHGAMPLAAARYTGIVFAVFCLGLLPYMIFQLQLRVFYSMHDSRTPALIGLVTMTVNIVANLVALSVLPARDVVAGLGVGFGLANVAGMLLAWRILTRRLRGLDGYRIGRSLVRMHAATLPAALVAVLVGLLTGGNAIVEVVVGGGLALGMYLLFARALRVEELTGLSRALLSKLGR
jgi:putative peptidoglycan lipid II flippase